MIDGFCHAGRLGTSLGQHNPLATRVRVTIPSPLECENPTKHDCWEPLRTVVLAQARRILLFVQPANVGFLEDVGLFGEKRWPAQGRCRICTTGGTKWDSRGRPGSRQRRRTMGSWWRHSSMVPPRL
jgi:hypothetical protein